MWTPSRPSTSPEEVAGDAGGIVWATRAGDVRYADANHRRGTVAALTLDACDVLVTPIWSRTTDGPGQRRLHRLRPDPRTVASNPVS